MTSGAEFTGPESTGAESASATEIPQADPAAFKPEKGTLGMLDLIEQTGRIFSVPAPGTARRLILAGQEYVAPVCDDAHYDKLVTGPLSLLRENHLVGLFTDHTDEPDWRKAHAILMPAFSRAAIHSYLPLIFDPASQLVMKWARTNFGEDIDLVADTTRLTFETIGLVGFGYRFGSFYREGRHPFIEAMVTVLTDAMMRGFNPATDLSQPPPEPVISAYEYLDSFVAEVVAQRRNYPDLNRSNDLLDRMLHGVDQTTGTGLDDRNITNQIITFLIAGHETTSGLLSFTIYELLNNPEVLDRCYAEVDAVLGDDLDACPSAAQVSKLRYVMQVLKETLRLWPPAPGFVRHTRADTRLLDRYNIRSDDPLTVHLMGLHRDPSVWGDDPERFDPDRFTAEAEAALPAGAYLPFGIGQRSCIGRQFALFEAQLVIGMILQRFKLAGDSDYQLEIKQSLTIKPDNLRIKVQPRQPRQRPAGPVVIGQATAPAIASTAPEADEARQAEAPSGAGSRLLVLFGSNLGTAEGVAREIVADARRVGFDVTAGSLDAFVNKLERDTALVVVTASYNGQPPDNAVKFCEWLRTTGQGSDLSGLRYAVFGCGDRNWASTFQAVPTFVDEALEQHGATRILPRGLGDASDDFDGQFRTWYADFWKALGESLGLSAQADVAASGRTGWLSLSEGLPARQGFFASIGAHPMLVTANIELQDADADGTSSTRLIDLAVPAGVSYQAGDHLAVLPLNQSEAIYRAAAVFGVDPETMITMQADGNRESHLPLGEPRPIGGVIAGYLELHKPATRAQIAAIIEFASDPAERARLAGYTDSPGPAGASYRSWVLESRRTLIDLLEENPSCRPPHSLLIELMPELKPRFYSVASSSQLDPRRLSLLVGVLNQPARSGHGVHSGTASNYLAESEPGHIVHAFVRRPGLPFWPPADPSTPMIMVATGTGIAPFRGFLQDRAAAAANQPVAQSMLFFGCRNSGSDFLLADELKGYAQTGIAELITAFSDEPGQPPTRVQDRIHEHASQVFQSLQQGATVYVCGHAGRVAPAVREALAQVHQDSTGSDLAVATAWVEELRSTHRLLEDVWASA